MNTKHTPGPWRVGTDDRSIFTVRGTTSAGMQHIATAAGCASLNDADLRANARLIAAAPDLAAWAVYACSIIEQAIEYSEWNATNFGRGTTFRSGGYDADYVLEALRAALRKAGVIA